MTVYMTVTMGDGTVVSCKADTAFCFSYMMSLPFLSDVEIFLFLLPFCCVLVDCCFDYIIFAYMSFFHLVHGSLTTKVPLTVSTQFFHYILISMTHILRLSDYGQILRFELNLFIPL